MSTFKKKLGISQKELNYLARQRIVEIQQGGFKSDCHHHHKIVVVRDTKTIELFLNPKIVEEEVEPLEPLLFLHKREDCKDCPYPFRCAQCPIRKEFWEEINNGS